MPLGSFPSWPTFRPAPLGTPRHAGASAQATLGRDVHVVAEGLPDGSGRLALLECLEDGATTERTQHVVPGQRPGVGLAELVVHQGPEVAHPHEPSLPPKPGTAMARIVV